MDAIFTLLPAGDDPMLMMSVVVFAAAATLAFGLMATVRVRRAGFPDFMDLLVVCADAGLSMEAALDRVGRELADSYPSLSSNIYMTTLEVRAGRRMSEALEHFADRLGLEEARSFATLLQQS